MKLQIALQKLLGQAYNAIFVRYAHCVKSAVGSNPATSFKLAARIRVERRVLIRKEPAGGSLLPGFQKRARLRQGLEPAFLSSRYPLHLDPDIAALFSRH